MPGWSPLPAGPEVNDLADDLRRIFHELDRQAGHPVPAATGQCSPALDVLETDETVEILVDLPGVDPAFVRVVLKGGLVLLAGEKRTAAPDGGLEGDFHLVERGFGRFARAVRVAPAVDGGRACVTLNAGELRIVLPRIHERRGQARALSIDRGEQPESSGS